MNKFAVWSLPKRADAMPVKVIAYLLIAVASVLIAVAIFIKLWNVFLGANTIENDVQSLARISENMLKDERPYLQQPFFLQIENKGVIAFEKNQAEFALRWNDAGKKIPRPEQCGTNVCVCLLSDDNEVEKCYQVKSADDKKVVMLSDYMPYYVDNEDAIVPPQREDLPAFNKVPATAEIKIDLYRSFYVDNQIFDKLYATQKRVVEGEKTKAVVPLLLEKVTEGDKQYLIIQADHDRSRSRNLFLYVCNNKGDPECTAETAVSSFEKHKPKYCAYEGPIATLGYESDKDKELCRLITLNACIENTLITQPCLCGDSIAAYGYCVDNVNQALKCELITSCEDYCKQDATSDGCNDKEADLCVANTCRILDENGNPCGLYPNNNVNQCKTEKKNEFDATLIQVQNTINLLLGRPDAYARETVTVPIGEDAIIGFDSSDTTVSGRPVPTACTSRPCLCGVSDGDIYRCVTLTSPNSNQVILGSDNNAHQVTSPKATLAIDPSKATEFQTSPFVISSQLYDITPYMTSASLNDLHFRKTGISSDDAVVEVTLEKITRGDKTYITAVPAGSRATLRPTYVVACTGGTDCAGKSPFVSYNTETATMCSLDSTGACSITSVPVCAGGQAVTAPCSCGGKLITSGICWSDAVYDVDCKAVTSCSQYCQGAGCSVSDSKICQLDPCKVSSRQPLQSCQLLVTNQGQPDSYFTCVD